MRAYIKLAKGVKSAIDLSKETNVSRAHIYRMWEEGITFEKKRKMSPGRPPKIGERTVQQIMRAIAGFSVMSNVTCKKSQK